MALANYPGFFVSSQPTEAQPFGVFWPALVANDEVQQVVVLADGGRIPIRLLFNYLTKTCAHGMPVQAGTVRQGRSLHSESPR